MNENFFWEIGLSYYCPVKKVIENTCINREREKEKVGAMNHQLMCATMDSVVTLENI